MNRERPGDAIRAVDLFCGAGGFSWGLVEALKNIAIDADQPTEAVLKDSIDLVGVNHWEQAIATHKENHPWARHFLDDIQAINPRDVFDERDPDVKILSGGIECTHWSTARGGKPVDDQKRMPAWDFLTWIQKLRPENVLVENVKEFASWGPIESDGTPTRNGETFEAWIDSFHSLGYSIDWKVLNAANYGDATSRQRLFILARRENRPEWPEPTHTEDGEGDTQEWRTAADIIDWSEPGGSIWTRDLHDARKRPLKNSTMQRIAEGVRRHCSDRLEPLADALAELGRKDVKQLRQSVVPFEYAETAADVLDEPFLVEQPAGTTPVLAAPYLLRQQSGGQPPSIENEPVPTISSAGSIAKVEPRPLIMPRNGAMGGLQSNSLYRPEDRPLHTVTARNTDGYLVTPYLCPMYNSREGQRPRTRAVNRPLMTIPASKSPAGIAEPFLVDYHGNSDVSACDIPLGAVEARDRYALCVPEEFPWGLDVRYRMLQPRELQRAQGFPDDYEILGNKRDTTRQIGNAVPVNLAQSLVESLLESSTPSLTDYLSDQTPSVGVEDTPARQTGVVSDD